MGVLNAVYQAWDAVSNSRLGWLKRSCSDYKYYSEHPKDPTYDMAIGTGLHSLVLTPEDMEAEIAVAPEINRRTKEGKAQWIEFQDANVGKDILTQDQFEKSKAMGQALLLDDDAGGLLCIEGDREVSVVFDWPLPDREPIRCKARFDLPLKELGYIADVKTSSDCSRDGFPKSVWNFSYYRQAGFYVRAAQLSGYMDPEQFLFLCVDSGAKKCPPYNTAVYVMDSDVVLYGMLEAEDLMARLAKCIETDTWPSYAQGVQPVSLPPWAWAKMKELGYVQTVEQSKQEE